MTIPAIRNAPAFAGRRAKPNSGIMLDGGTGNYHEGPMSPMPLFSLSHARSTGDLQGSTPHKCRYEIKTKTKGKL